MRPACSNRYFVALAAGVGTLGSLTIGLIPSASAATPKVGGTCAKSQVGRTSGSLVCAKTGTKYKWKTASQSAATAATPTNPATAPTVSDDAVKAAIEGAIGGGVTFRGGPCTAQRLKDGSCQADVTFEGTPPGTSSLLTLDSMSTMIFERQLVAYELQEVSGAGIKMWWNRRWEIIFAATRPLNEFSTHHRVSIILNFPPGSPVDATIKDRLVALAKAVDAITSA